MYKMKMMTNLLFVLVLVLGLSTFIYPQWGMAPSSLGLHDTLIEKTQNGIEFIEKAIVYSRVNSNEDILAVQKSLVREVVRQHPVFKDIYQKVAIERTIFLEIRNHENQVLWDKEYPSILVGNTNSRAHFDVLVADSTNTVVVLNQYDLFVGENRGSLFVYNGVGRELIKFDLIEYDAIEVQSIHLSPNGRYLAIRIYTPPGYKALIIDVIENRKIIYDHPVQIGSVDNEGIVRYQSRDSNETKTFNINN